MNLTLPRLPSLADLLRAGSQISDPVCECAAIVSLIPLLLLVAFWNGFPLIYYDTGAYVLEGLGHHFLVERSPVYSLFLGFAGAGISLWTIVLLQAAATAFVMVETARCMAPGMRLSTFLAICAGLILATGLPWYVGEVEPDCFAAILVLAIYLLAFRADTLGRPRTVALIVVGACAAAAHTSHLLLALALWSVLAMGAVLRIIVRSTGSRPRLALPGTAFLLAAALVLSSNYFLTRQVFVTRAGPAFLFARLLQDRIVMRLLENTCPQSRYRLCAYKDFLPRTANGWLWTQYSPFLRLGGYDGTKAESERIVFDSLRRYPLMNMEAALSDAARQFVSFRTGDQIEPQQWAIEPAFSTYLHAQVAPYLAAKQQEGMIGFTLVNLLHVPVGFLSLGLLAALAGLSLRRGKHESAAFLGFVLLALVGNALICGALSNPHDRYQSRVMWLATFAVALVLGDAMAARDTRTDEKLCAKPALTSESPCEA